MSLSIRNLKKTYESDLGAVQAVRGIDLDVRQGECFTLLGPSGCGKTTTLRCVAGLETPDEGEIRIGDKVVFSAKEHIAVPVHKRDIGMVFQSYAIWPHMTVGANVAYPLKWQHRHLSPKEVDARVLRALSMVQLEHVKDRPAPFLSGGQQQRVALARALVHEPKLLLLDEPLSNLDAKLREEMRTELKELFSVLGVTVLYVTHDQLEALSLSARLAVMANGTVLQEGAPKELYQRPRERSVASFLGEMNLLPGRLLPRHDQDFAVVETALGPLRCVPPNAPDAGEQVLVGIRPEAVEISTEAISADNTIPGKMLFLSFCGDYTQCKVDVNGYVMKCRIDPYIDIQEGAAVYLRLAPARCAIFNDVSQPS